ncbi:rhodanese-like protein [Leptospira inadai serovar Lyme str. 10]|uniref:Rhodanese-like protein n=2 Tax=Leptospira inadai serovar Lyme TaxID=293084 RepID=V6HWT1_9LEPT|nr:rhodanese-like domain-containing protein [Leptospira inadai]EQA37429.1 rhodanese-like protein [Leptospira inadai serovar Lyme str. 10]PNV73348.1 thiosulfate sulfurtransferase [Leptospira inadai serovar Lyme]
MSNWSFLKSDLSDQDLLIDCRSQAQYQEATLKGAYYFPFVKKAFASDPESFKKMLGPLDEILALAKKEGKSRIVVFDEGMGMFAARLTLLLRSAGFVHTYVLDKRWPVEEGTEKGSRELDFGPASKIRKLEGIIDKAFLEKNLTRLQIFDTRTPEEYEGKLPRLTAPEPGSLCGRLPGAFLWDWRMLYDPTGDLVDKTFFNKKLRGFPFMPERTTVIYDYNGARSSLLALMLKEVGYNDVNVYIGSWFEWRKSSLPKQAVNIYGQAGGAGAAPRVGGAERKN